MSPSEDTIIFTITDAKEAHYPPLAVLWARFLDKLNISNYIVYCLDKKSFDYLDAKGVRCKLYQKKPDIKYKKFTGKETARVNKRFGRMSVYKLMIAKELLGRGKNIIYADTDALFCLNPLPLISLLLSKYDCLLSVAPSTKSFPQKVSEELGFSFCTGFFALKASQKSVDFIDDLKGKLANYGSLQAAINFYLLPYLRATTGKSVLDINKLGLEGALEAMYAASARQAFDVEGFAIKTLPQQLVRRAKIPTTDNYVIHVAGRVKKGNLGRYNGLYKKLYG